MAKQLILLVHGMGTHPKGAITTQFKQALAERADSFGLDSAALLAKVDYKEFNYSEYFDAIRKQFADNAAARKKGFGFLSGQGFDEKLITQLTDFEKNLGKDEFFCTHWLDVILYSTMYFGEKLRVDFIKLFETLREQYIHRNIHIVSHSLGTALVHDALAKYYRKESSPLDQIPDVPLGKFNIASLWTFANVSRMVNILNNLSDPLTSTVVTGAQGCTNRFINVRNKYDPFTWFKPYERTMQAIEDRTITTIRKSNTHDFYEYVTEPAVARGLLQIIYGANVSEAQLQAGTAAYHEGTLSTEVKELKKLVEAVASDPSIDSIGKAIAKFKLIKQTIEKLKKDFNI